MSDRTETALGMHDQLLLSAPEGVSHDADLCPFCRDWALTDDGVPSGHRAIEYADAKQPYGAVEYADPGYQADKVKRYPIDSEAHARAAWSYIHQAGNAEKYTADQLSSMRTKIAAALKKFGVEADDKEVEKHKKLADAKNGSKQPNNTSPNNKASAADHQPEVASEGGTPPMETITVETHEALLDKALRDATASLESEKAELASEVAALKETAEAATTEIASLKADNERINGELDTAQIAVKTAEDELSELKADLATKDEAAAKAAVETERADQVRNLGLFTEEYIADKASRWADMDDVAWSERLDEWKTAKDSTSAPTSTDTASAMTGTHEVPSGAEPSARRRVLGLV